MPMKHTTEDLAAARATSTFDVSKMTDIVHGPRRAKTLRFLTDLAKNDHILRKDDRPYLGRTERFYRSMQIQKRYIELRNQYGFDVEELMYFRWIYDEYAFTDLHELMFLPTLRAQASAEQLAKWMPEAENFKWIGCYAQTELGHGSNVKELETRAVLDLQTDEWVLDTPTITSSKFWIGALGRMATHAILMAQLVIKGQSFGIHPFLLPLRSLKDHTVLPGITIMDIGPKIGANSQDNGFMQLKGVRIPRENMLMRYSRVTREGAYIKPPHDRLSYGTMTYVRVTLVDQSFFYLSRAVTIATRYTAVRRQNRDQSISGMDGGEVTVMDYGMVQHRLFPLIVLSYAFAFTRDRMTAMYHQMIKQINDGDMSMLAQVHAESSGLKSYCTLVAAEGIEEARRVCGGHGYSQASGIPGFYGTFLASNTYEGENYLLTQQTTKYLIRQLRSFQSKKTGDLSPDTAYLQRATSADFGSEKIQSTKKADLASRSVQAHALEHRAARLVLEVADMDAVSGRRWTDLNVAMARAARAHSQLFVWRALAEKVDSVKRSGPEELVSILSEMRDIYFLWILTGADAGDFLEDGYAQGAQARDLLAEKLKNMRKNAVALVDAFDWDDYVLDSALGRYDGKVYEALIEFAKKEPLNKQPVVFGYQEIVRPLLDGQCGTYKPKSRL
ncbi:uncharacterized protein SPPG_00161 [Spizellomyces punctatus DAOM BR117]|uniref:Acyl-coenzyme A oxidase n=1 Tax=Spizellomyces punctatus (strain DAOM BR117) TaxID=645134 RepID=A0A0L0HTK8_SPIPD|nr:uncharacterized protein SPPG_00161 [Spizellomyces punctatus DAOM BR117]KND04432.1 hypothetical protein SPPG_00161 [Spizellomyces punctatus DAOM BR117]|eukprot:XP_016612471.1 hypothetical protein SPPG_00161 [Spizellomyces punctatus DAOM BR117]